MAKTKLKRCLGCRALVPDKYCEAHRPPAPVADPEKLARMRARLRELNQNKGGTGDA